MKKKTAIFITALFLGTFFFESCLTVVHVEKRHNPPPKKMIIVKQKKQRPKKAIIIKPRPPRPKKPRHW
ncbi:MAG: hypothetical protein JXB50_05680 [Spirochaetes bacterium]|nr:hypothetical protein [Spirochaetota bacterium]